MATGGGETPTASQFAELLSVIKGVESSVDEKFLQMRRELKDERESADERLIKRMRIAKKPIFRKIGHEKQYEFNEEVQEKLDSADTALAQRPPAVEKARTLLQEGEKLIFIRQKKIRIADRSENGRATVKAYEEDELAENLDDEKRISRAEARAVRIKKQKQNTKNFNSRRRGQPPSGATRVPVSVLPATPVGGAGGEVAQATMLFCNLVSPMRQNSTSSGNSQLGPCFMCGKLGHFSK